MEAAAIPRTWTIVGHLDATARNLEPATTREAIDLQHHAPTDVGVVVQLRRRSATPARQKIVGTLEKAVLPAAVAAIVGLTLGLHLSPLVTAGLASELAGVGIGAYLDGHRRIQAARKQEQFHQEPAWSGTRTFDISAAPSSDMKAVLRAPTLESGTLAQLISDARSRYPAQHTAFLVSGHGNAYRKLAGMKPAEIGQALAAAEQQSGRKVDLVIAEACKGANLEMLDALGPHAKYAVASEDDMWEAGFPWQRLLADTSAKDARALGEDFVRTTGGVEHRGVPQVPTVSLIDLEKIPDLKKSVDALGLALNNALEGGHRDAIQAAFNETRHFPRQEPARCRGFLGKLEAVYRKVKRDVLYPDLGDIGGLVKNLRKHVTDAQTARALDEVERDLAAAVVANQVHPTYAGEATGLTVRMVSPVFFEKNYARKTGMPAWGHLLNQMRPWRARFGSNVLEGAWDRVSTLFSRRGTG